MLKEEHRIIGNVFGDIVFDRFGKGFGRTFDILYTPEGKKISGISILDTFMIHIKGFRKMQIIQNKPAQISFKIIRDENYDETSLEALKKTVLNIFGPNMRYETEFVEKIPMTKRGKFQFTICIIEKE